MTRGITNPESGAVSAADVQKYLKGLHYPAKKQELVKKAQEHGADNDTLSAIKALPDQEFGGPQDVMKAFSQRH